MPRKCLVILSGGQDSTTCLFLARQEFEEVHCLTIAYGQRHKVELDSALKVAQMAGCGRRHELLNLGPILKSTSPLVNFSNQVGHYAKPEDMPGGIEPTFVPARNLLFLTIAANRAVAIGPDCRDLYLGVSQADFGGYPDCRAEFLETVRPAMSNAMGDPDYFRIHAPLLNLTKRQTVELAVKTPGAYDALAYTHTCYDGQYPPNPLNHASLIRAKGFNEAKVADPLIVRAKRDGKLPADYPEDGYVVGGKYSDPAALQLAK